MTTDNNFSEMGAKIKEQSSLSQEKVKKNKFVPVIFLVFSLLLVFSTSAFAYQYFLEKIMPCSQSADGICFELVKNNTTVSKYQIKNLDESKNYRLVIKKKIGDSTVDVGAVDLDMSKIKEQRENKACMNRQQSSDSLNITCCEGFEIKSDLWNDASWSQFTCCKLGECSQDGICILNGQVFEDWDKKCDNGEWVNYDGTVIACTDSDGGKNYNVKGQVTKGDFSVEDQCSDDKKLLEVYCDGSELKREFYDCEFSCDEEEGACIAGKQWGEMCHGNEECEIGYTCKSSARYPVDSNALYSESYCCKTDECGSVIPEGPGSGDAVPNCVVSGGTDQIDTPSGVIKPVCDNGEYPNCDHHNKTSSNESDLNCCGDLLVKDDLWSQTDPGYSNFACCEPNECHQDGVCVPDGEDHVTDWGVVCNSGNWEGTLISY